MVGYPYTSRGRLHQAHCCGGPPCWRTICCHELAGVVHPRTGRSCCVRAGARPASACPRDPRGDGDLADRRHHQPRAGLRRLLQPRADHRGRVVRRGPRRGGDRGAGGGRGAADGQVGEGPAAAGPHRGTDRVRLGVPQQHPAGGDVGAGGGRVGGPPRPAGVPLPHPAVLRRHPGRGDHGAGHLHQPGRPAAARSSGRTRGLRPERARVHRCDAGARGRSAGRQLAGGGRAAGVAARLLRADRPRQSGDRAGRPLKEVEFRATYQAAVLAIHRAGHRIDAKLGDVRLRTGDTLLLLADRGFRSRYRESGDFLLIAGLGQAPAPPSRKAPLVGAIVFGVVVLAGVGLVPILEAALGAAILLVAVGALSLTEARRSVDIDVLIVIAAAFGLSAAVTESGLADALAGSLLAVFAPFGAIGALVGVLLATMALTEVLTNNAAAVLLFPIAMSTAAAVGADPRPFAIMVLLGASLSFLTPIGYQTNLMVYGLGGYRFGDYARLGLPLNLVVFTLALLLVPQLWPL